ncbi:MAG TPA: hypothetical protein VGL87_09675 [Steroidobacteraceae bacterium]
MKRLYDVDLSYDVCDFLVTDRRELRGVSPANDGRAPEEELLLAQTADGAGVSLYIDPEVLSRLEASDPMGALTEGNIADYCTALEGVSHFVYSAWRLGGDAPVSLLELETQAEVDKYAATVFLIADQQGGGFPAHVHPRLFDRVSFDARLEAEQYERYRTAHRCAANFCRRLERRFVGRSGPRIEAMVRELRKFYRLGHAAKLRYAMS